MKHQATRALVVLLGCVMLGWLGLQQIVAAPLAECTTTQIKISEVESDAPTSWGNDTDNEWIELYNTGSACTLTGWMLQDNTSSDTIPTVNLGANGRLVIAATSNFTVTHPTFSGALVVLNGSIGNGLADAGDVLRLRDASSVEADCISWGSNTACLNPAVPQNAANTTATYQRTPTDGTDTDAAADWTSASETPQGLPTAVTLSTFVARRAIPFDMLALIALGLLGFLGILLRQIKSL